MSVDFRCPSCSAVFQDSNVRDGDDVTCPACQFPHLAKEATVLQAVVPPPPPRPLRIGDILGKHRLTEVLGSGGMGTVYKAVHITLGKTRAIKVPRLTSRPGDDVARRFSREAQSVAALRHPNICDVIDDGEQDGWLFLILEFVDGKPLDKARPAGQRWSLREAAEVVRAVARAVHHAHEKGVIHRDLKPANILLQNDGRPVVMDFGLAKWASDTASTLTVAGQVLGTPEYMSPEQADGNHAEIGPTADVYSLGVVLYELLTGELPYGRRPTQSMQTIFYRLASVPVPSARAKRPEVDPRLDAICKRAMEKAAVDRYPTMAAFADELDEYLRGVRVVVVDRAGRGDHRTITEAVKAAKPGTVVRIRPGVYRESLVLNTDITLEGDEDRAGVVETDTGDVIHFSGGNAIVRNLTLRRLANSVGKRDYGVWITAGRPTVVGCDISSESSACLTVENNQTDPYIVNCDMHHSRQGCGILVHNGARGTFERCVARENKLAGISVSGSADPVVRDCRSIENGALGIFVYEGGRGVFERCVVQTNKLHGIEVRESGAPTISGCTVIQNQQYAIRVYKNGKGTFIGNNFSGNKRGAKLIEDACTPVLRDNQE